MKQSNFSRKKNVPINCLLGSAQVRISLSDYKSGLSPVLANCSTPFCMFQQGCRLVAAGSKRVRQSVLNQAAASSSIDRNSMQLQGPMIGVLPVQTFVPCLLQSIRVFTLSCLSRRGKPVRFRGGKRHSI